MICPKCKQEMRQIPAGVSKKTGNPYKAFWVCDNNCNKSSQPTQAPGSDEKVVDGLRAIYDILVKIEANTSLGTIEVPEGGTNIPEDTEQ